MSLNGVVRFIVCAILCLGVFQLQAIEQVKVALVFDGKSWEEDPFVTLVKQEVNDLLKGEFEVEYVPFYDTWDYSHAQTLINQAENDPSIDLVIPFGALAAYAAVNSQSLVKPVILPFDIRLFIEDSQTTVETLPPNLVYFRGKWDFKEDLKLFEKVTGSTNIAVIGDDSILGVSDFPVIRDLIARVMAEAGKQVVFVPVKDSIDKAIEFLTKSNVNGVVLLPTWRLSEESFRSLVSELNAMDLPTFSAYGEHQVEMGVLMTTSSFSEERRAARRIALNCQEMLLNRNSSTIVIDFSRADQLIINQKTAKAIGLDLTWHILNEAKLIDTVSPAHGEFFDLKKAAEVAVKQNLDLSVERYIVKSGRQQVLQALAPLMPQLGSKLVGRRIDSNSAKFGGGAAPQRLVRGGLHLDQLIYDDKTVADYTSEKRLQAARVYNKKAFELDIMRDATEAYLLVLRVKAEKEIAIENLNLTKANLKRAHELVDSGQARLSEVYRWESELSSNREELVRIEARLENVEAVLNRILNRCIRSPIHLQDIDPEHPTLLTDLGSLIPYINTPAKYEQFKSVMVDQALKCSPELEAINQKIYAQERQLTARKRAFYLPSFSAFADAEKNLWKDGTGSKAPPGISNTRVETAVGVSITYPLFTGGQRRADKCKAYYDLLTLQTEREALMQKIDENVVQVIDRLKANHDNISFAKRAKEAAEKNLVIVINSYARGTVSIVDLIDAQNVTNVAKSNYSNTVYDYLINFMEFQRAISQFVYFWPKQEKELFMQEVVNRI